MTQRTAVCLIPSPDHKFPGHPESPGRFASLDASLKGDLGSAIDRLEVSADRDDVLETVRSVHSEEYIRMIRNAMERAPLFLDYGDTYATPQSFQSAIDAVAGTLAVVQQVQSGKNKRGFALIRPPGHHASEDRAEGFCLFNNIAIAAKVLQNHGYAKIAIYDFDVHHGNGTQAIFYDDPDVLYISTHQWGIYPGTGAKHETGGPPAEGSTLNIPLPAYCGDRAFTQLMEQVIQPALSRFDPDCMLISAGFDAHWSDPLANLQLSTSGYFAMASQLAQTAASICNGRIAFVLEGGYDPDALADNVSAVLHALADLPQPPDRLGPASIDEPDIDSLLEDIKSLHSL